ncbi:hypothetical protein KIN20_002104, partial [Parelaphostrongylus tenuis]
MQRCLNPTTDATPVYDPGRFSPPQLDTPPPPPVLNTPEQRNFNFGSTTGDLFSFEKHNNSCWNSSEKINNNHSVTRKFSAVADFFSPPSRPEVEDAVANNRNMNDYQSMQLNTMHWLKPPLFQQIAVQSPQVHSINNTTIQRKISRPSPSDLSIGSPPFASPSQTNNAQMDQVHVSMVSPQSIITPASQMKSDDNQSTSEIGMNA